MKVIAIIGSRRFDRVFLNTYFTTLGMWLRREQREILSYCIANNVPQPLPPFAITTGLNGNVDVGAKQMTETFSLPLMGFPADWNGPLGLKSGPHRNGYIANFCHIAIAIHDGSSRGTKNAIAQIKAQGKPVLIPTTTTPYEMFDQTILFLRSRINE